MSKRKRQIEKKINLSLNNYNQKEKNHHPSFQPLPLLVQVSLEQIEEEGANEELEAQMKNNGYCYGLIKTQANDTKAVILNHFINLD
ncbi:MAG: hypothetical protein EZS28_049041 [Streblomastix strix]|uniref:Uncharacterized protein n=1 Tax=Streblomastix strix TaxID=222440 RepID=A0A5J4TBY5_9EUKA|nr:MAG: hypothetical protein EZS28_049041 [Streblomastix strix]